MTKNTATLTATFLAATMLTGYLRDPDGRLVEFVCYESRLT